MQTRQSSYLYHLVPADLKGHILYLLNQLKSVYPRRSRRYFEIDPIVKGFNAANAVIFLHQRVNLEKFQLDEADFQMFNPTEIRSLCEIPESTIAYYKEMFIQGQRPLT
jgi:hypothetical protein